MFGLLLLFTSPAIAPAQDQCPMVIISSSAFAKGKANYTAGVSDGDPNVTPTYNWAISNGTIVSGKGTSSITVEAEPGTNVTATVDVGGYARECPTSASSTELINAGEAPDCPQLILVTDSPARGKGIFGAQLFPQPAGIKWNWNISAGRIVRGQGSSRIDIEAAPGSSVTGTITIGGAPEGCTLSETQELAIK